MYVPSAEIVHFGVSDTYLPSKSFEQNLFFLTKFSHKKNVTKIFNFFIKKNFCHKKIFLSSNEISPKNTIFPS